ncbi:MAG: DegT/DnrJ/EryC1/StrS family aminotransferase [Gemmatimonadota bacterium]|nr:DegT/DnrJ/EryC1/StrS family aminotransferase [Gemmatimonadota bacterium]
MRIRHQLPVYSPISGTAVLRAAMELPHVGRDPRSDLVALLQREYDASSVLLCGSGTQALTIAIREALKRVDIGSPVALPAFSCFDVASAAVGADARVSFYDLDPDSLGPDLSSLERAFRAGAAVAVIAPLYGIPVGWGALSDLATLHNVVLIEDAAQGHGALWGGRPLGTLGDIATLSFGRGKGWTGGNGGAVLTRNGLAAPTSILSEPDFSREAATVAALAAQWALARPEVYAIPRSIPGLGLGDTIYRAPVPETSITRAAADALLATHDSSQREAEARRANAKLLASIADRANLRIIPVQPDACAGYLRLPVRLSRGMATFSSPSRALVLGIAPSYPRALSDLAQVAAISERTEGGWPGAQTLVRELVTLPTHSRLRPGDREEISEVLRTVAR